MSDIEKINKEVHLKFNYKKNEDYSNMIKYYETLAELGDNNAVDNLCHYYKSTQDITNIVKYYEMAVDNNNFKYVDKLIIYYFMLDNLESLLLLYKKINNMEGLIDTLESMLSKYRFDKTLIANIIIETNFDEYELSNGLSMLKKSLTHNLDSYDLHFTYSINGLGYEKAKTDFIELLSS